MESFYGKFAPACPYCGNSAELACGKDVYPGRKFAEKLNLWRCEPCDAHVGCHRGTLQPMGSPTRRDLRQARSALHSEVLDPLWETADELPCYDRKRERNAPAIRRAARSRVYGWLSEKLGLPLEETHVGMFDLETCRAARGLLEGVSYMEIRSGTMPGNGPKSSRASGWRKRNREVASKRHEGENGREQAGRRRHAVERAGQHQERDRKQGRALRGAEGILQEAVRGDA